MIWKKLWSRLLSLYWGWRRMFYKNTLPVFIRNKFIIRSLQIPVLSSNKGSKTKVFWHCCSAFFVEFVHVFVIEKSSRWMKKSRTCQIMNRKQVQEIRVKIILWLQRLNDEDLSRFTHELNENSYSIIASQRILNIRTQLYWQKLSLIWLRKDVITYW